MKWLSILSILPASALAFQAVSTTPIRVQRASVVIANFFPDKFARAEECATHYGTCSVDELEDLANGMFKKCDVFVLSSIRILGISLSNVLMFAHCELRTRTVPTRR